MTRVDVCVPSYNYARFLPQCVGSILRQTGVEVSVNVIDDASTDNTVEVGERLAAEDLRVTYRRHAVNCGHIATYNEGIEAATGDYFLLLSADDVLTDGALLRATRLMDAHPDVGFVHGRQISFTSAVPFCTAADIDQASSSEQIVTSAEFIEGCFRSGVNGVSTPTVVVRTALQKTVGGYLKELPHSGDLEMWLRMAAQGCSVGILSTAQAFRRRHEGAMHLEFTRAFLGDLQQRQAAFETFLREQRHRLPDAGRLGPMIRVVLAEEAFWAASAAFDAGDLPTCEVLLAYALELAPTLMQSPHGVRLAWKRRLGPTLWRAVRPIFSHVRPKRWSPATVEQDRRAS